MKESIFRVSLDIHTLQSQMTLGVKKGETSRKIGASLTEHGMPYIIGEKCFATFQGTKADGTKILDNCTIENNQIIYSFTEQTTAVSGILNADFILYGADGGIIASPHITIIVDERAIGSADTIISEDELLLIDNIAKAEVKRVDAEELRAVAEDAREFAEEGRVEAELKRESNTTTAIENAEEATEKANNIADTLQDKLDKGEFKGEKGDKGDKGDMPTLDDVANAIKGYANGNVVKLDEVSPIEHNVKTKVGGKNFFDVSKITVSITQTNEHISEVGDNYIIVTTPDGYNSNGYCGTRHTLREICPQLQVGKTYTINATTQSALKCIHLSSAVYTWNFGTETTITDAMLNSYVVFYGLSAKNGQGVGDCRISNIQIEEGEIATDYEPYIDPTTVTVTVCGKNLWKYGDIEFTTSKSCPMYIKKDAIITFTADVVSNDTDSNTCRLACRDIDGTFHHLGYLDRKNNSSVTIMLSYAIKDILLYASDATSGSSGDTATFKNVQLEIGKTATDFEEYKGKTYTPNADGTCNVKSVSPFMQIFTDTEGVNIECEYNKDTSKVVMDEKLFTFNCAELGSNILSKSIEAITRYDVSTLRIKFKLKVANVNADGTITPYFDLPLEYMSNPTLMLDSYIKNIADFKSFALRSPLLSADFKSFEEMTTKLLNKAIAKDSDIRIVSEYDNGEISISTLWFLSFKDDVDRNNQEQQMITPVIDSVTDFALKYEKHNVPTVAPKLLG